MTSMIMTAAARDVDIALFRSRIVRAEALRTYLSLDCLIKPDCRWRVTKKKGLENYSPNETELSEVPQLANGSLVPPQVVSETKAVSLQAGYCMYSEEKNIFPPDHTAHV